MAIFRVIKEKNYTVVSNYILNDERISLKAKALLCQMLSLPDDWDYTVAGLCSKNRESKAAIRSALNELENAGYLERSRVRGSDGRLNNMEYIIHEAPIDKQSCPEVLPEPASENRTQVKNGEKIKSCCTEVLPEPASDFPTLENPTLENRTQQSTNRQSTNTLNTNKTNDTEKCLSVLSVRDGVPSSSGSGDRTERTDAARIVAKDTACILSPDIRARLEWDAVRSDPIDYGVSDFSKYDMLCQIVDGEIRKPRNLYRIFGEEISGADLKNTFLRLNRSHLVHVLKNVEQSKPLIRNEKRYYIAALYRAPETINQPLIERYPNAERKGQFYQFQSGQYDYAAIEAALREN